MINYYASAIGVQTKIQDAVNSIETHIVCTINSVDVERQLYSATPILKSVDKLGNIISKATIISCPFSHSITTQFGISNPFSEGDVVLVAICKESIEVALDAAQNTGAQHNAIKYFRLLDGVIVGGILRTGTTISGLSPNELKIYSRQGNANIILKTNGEVIINADTVTINGNTNINGNVNVSGDIDITGKSTATDHESSGISGSGHVHGGVMAGGSNTGAPV